MAERLVVDPITRIEGHLRVEVEIDENNKIKEAYSSGTAVRGIVLIGHDRDPSDVWAFVQRICGVCTTTHALASIRSVEHALGIEVPLAGHIVRNIIHGTLMMHDHVVHFYHLHALDWVDVVDALNADPAATSQLAQTISPHWPKSSPGYFKDIQDKVKKLVDSKQLGIFANGYWGHEAYNLPPEANLMAVAHYLEALEWQKEIVKVHTILGGKNPHPHYLVGGMATPLDPNSDNAINIEKLMHIKEIIDRAHDFVNQVYVPDLIAIAGFYKDTAAYGGGIQNYLSLGDYSPTDHNKPDTYRFPRGAILNGELGNLMDVDLENKDEIQEFVDRSWYTYDGKDGGEGKHPYDGETTFNYTGPKEEYKNLDVDKKYSWIKAPKWKGNFMEVGPLARMVVGYASGKKEFKDAIDGTVEKLGIKITDLFSVLGRTAARGLETQLVADWTKEDMASLIGAVKNGNTTTFNGAKWDPSTWPKSANGVGYCEAPRGFLSHWIVIEDGKTANYQAVVPTTWNAAPKDGKKVAPYEASLMGTPVVDKEKPLEIIRVIHSFDPCLACAVHLTDLENQETTEIKIG